MSCIPKNFIFVTVRFFTAIVWWLLKNLFNIDPTSFTVSESIFILSIVIIGGMGNLTGSFLAATFMVLLPELLHFVGIPDSIAANIRQIIYGIIPVVVMMTGKNGVNELLYEYQPLKGSGPGK